MATDSMGDFWRQIINGLQLEKDLEGDPVFVTEDDKEEPDPQLPDASITNKDAAVLRFKLDLYVISPIGTGKAYLVTGKSQMEDAGIMTVKKALKLIEQRKKK